MELRDEALVQAYFKGYKPALDMLFKNHYRSLWFYLWKTSFFKDEPHIEDIRHRIVLAVLLGLKKRRYKPIGKGSFKAWLYTIARLECLKADKKRRRRPKPISRFFPEEPTGVPDDILPMKSHQRINYGYFGIKLEEGLKQLTPQERKLMRMVGDGKPYKQILKTRGFKKYSLDYLKHKICNIKKKLRKLRKE